MTLTVEQIEDWRTTFCEVYPQEYHTDLNMVCDMALAVANMEPMKLTGSTALIAENAALKKRVAELEEALSRSANGWNNVIEFDIIAPQHIMSAARLRDEARRAVEGK